MQKVLTAEEMREVDRLSVERFGIPTIELMENAANSVSAVIADRFGGHVVGRRLLILCGKGNNGGDGAALGRLLWTEGATVDVLLFGRVGETHGDARVNFELLESLIEDEHAANLTLSEEPREFETDGHYDVVVDALFGTGLSRPIDSVVLATVNSLIANAARSRPAPLFVSIDIPSGLFSDAPRSVDAENQLRADLTVTFTAPKLANVLPPAVKYNGELIVTDIGSPRELVEEAKSQTFLAEESDAVHWLVQSSFTDDSYKNKRGHALIVAGSRDYSGAAVLAGNAAMKSGAGLVTVATALDAQEAVASRILPEVIVRGLDFEDPLPSFFENADAVLAGCGLTVTKATRRFVAEIVRNRKSPLVLDADALNTLSPFELTTENHSPLILTPHEGEFKRLSGLTDLGDRVGIARDFALRHGVILVLKGERTLVAAPNGRVVINPTGNSGLGKAGNGDTLAGFIAGCAAQANVMKIDVFETVVAAVYIAGLAGDIAAEKIGKRAMLATDVRQAYSEAFARLEK